MAIEASRLLAYASIHYGVDSVDLVFTTLFGWDILHIDSVVFIGAQSNLFTFDKGVTLNLVHLIFKRTMDLDLLAAFHSLEDRVT